MNITLFDAAQSVRETVAKVNPDTGEIAESYSSSRELFDKKAGACVAYAVDETAQIQAAENMLKAMGAQLNARKTRLDRFKNYMLDCMKSAGVNQVAADGLARATLYPDRDVSVQINDDAVIPIEFCNDPKPPEPSKTKLKAAIESGQAVPAGVSLIRKDRLTIK